MPKKILIIDDEPDSVEVLKERLLANNYDVLYAYNSKTGIEKAILQKPDLIILDILLPGTNGMEVCQRLKENPKTKDIPIIFLTSLTNDDVVREGLEKGACYFVSKPYDPQGLLFEINMILKKSRI